MSEGILAMLIPFFAIGVGMGTLITWLVLWHRHRVRDLDQRHAERMAAIQQGQELPREALQATDSDAPHGGANGAPNSPAGAGPGSRYLLRGLVWLGVGLALSVGRANPFASDSGEGHIGWIAVAIGAAYLIYYYLEQRRSPGPPPPPPAS